MSLLKHSIVKICTLKVSFLGLTLQVSMDSCYYILYSWYQLKFQTRPTGKDFPYICESQPSYTYILFLHPLASYYHPYFIIPQLLFTFI